MTTWQELNELGETRELTLAALQEAQQENLPPHIQHEKHVAATEAVIAYEEATRPKVLLPYILQLLMDATRWRHIRDECPEKVGARTKEEADKIVDQWINELPDEDEEQESLFP